MAIAAASERATEISANEWHTRVELAACYRLFVRYGWTDLIFTHLTARVPDEADRYLINPYGLLFEEITASNLLKVDFDGNVHAGDDPYNKAGHVIHTAVLKARPDLNFVLHSHTRAGMAVSTMKRGLLPLTQQANEIIPITSSHKYALATSDEEECERLGRDLPPGKYAMIMENHGLLTAGRTAAEAFYFMYTLENACKVQVDAVLSGEELLIPDQAAREELAKWGMPSPDAPLWQSERAWPAMLRMLDRIDSSYRS